MEMTIEALNAIVPKNDYKDFAEFEFDASLGKFVGHIVHHEFRGLPVAERQRRIWDELRRVFGEDVQRISLVLTYSPDEWEEVGDDAANF